MSLSVLNLTRKKIDVNRWQDLAASYKINGTVVIVDVNKNPLLRAFSSSGNLIVIFDTKYETPKSLFWIFCHELRHLIVNARRNLRETIYNKRRDALCRAVEKYNQTIRNTRKVLITSAMMPEEFEADAFASEITGEYLGMEWRENRIKKLRFKNNKEKKNKNIF